MKLRYDKILSNIIVFWVDYGWAWVDFNNDRQNIIIEIIESGIF